MKRYKREVNLTNDELASYYDYLQGNINQLQLTREVHKTRTNTYYYLGRACEHFLQIGVLRFNPIQDQSELGGMEVPDEQTIQDNQNKQPSAARVAVQGAKRPR